MSCLVREACICAAGLSVVQELQRNAEQTDEQKLEHQVEVAPAIAQTTISGMDS